jgi:putative ABC transport system substrate-binding protein
MKRESGQAAVATGLSAFLSDVHPLPSRPTMSDTLRGLATTLLVALLFALVLETLPVDAQAPATAPRVGVLLATGGTVDGQRMEELRQGLRDLGWVEGRTIALDIRNSEGRRERLPVLAEELARLRVDVLVTSGAPAIRAAREASRTIPIVMARMDDADVHGFVESLARPGGNITGLSFQNAALAPKLLQLLKEAAPHLMRVSVLWDPAAQPRVAETAGAAIGVRTQVLQVRERRDYAQAFDAARKAQADGVVIIGSPNFTGGIPQLAELAAHHRLPAVYYNRRFAEAGGLMAYGPSEAEFSWRRAATFVDKILKGARPSDLPVEQPSAFDLVINLKTAQALGLAVPQTILIQATHVIR